MIRRGLMILGAVFLLGCSYGQNYLENPESILRDPHFGAYKDDRDALEKQYLHKKITYAEYIERRDALDAVYDKEVRERNNVIMTGE